jgi:cell wall-associated NlpC family hydrolase
VRRRAFLAVAATGGVLAYGRAGKLGTHPAARTASHPHPAVPSLPPAVVATVIAYARAQAGKPYLWGGTGPDAFDCSGLVMMAWAHAGVTIPRTSQEQWAGLPHVSSPQPGDLVFFPGSDGTWTAPGHVGLVTGQHLMIQAYAPGTPIGTYTFGVDNRGADIGPQYVVGYARPRA